VKEGDKETIVTPARHLVDLGFSLIATRGTARHLKANGLPVQAINKVAEGQPHIVDAMINGDVQLVLNTTEGEQAIKDSFSLRRTALLYKVPYYTTLAGARAAVLAIAALKQGTLDVAPLQSYFKGSF
jgi:carbamoyl-phosphate synthase large subunit